MLNSIQAGKEVESDEQRMHLKELRQQYLSDRQKGFRELRCVFKLIVKNGVYDSL